MSYYGGYASYTSYSATSYSTNYDYNTSYDATSCYATGQYIQNMANYNQEVRYGSYGNQCSNWQNTASTIMLWHLLIHQDNCRTWQAPTDKTIDISLEVDVEESAITGFTDGVLAFMEQIGGHVCLNTQTVNITIPETITQIDSDFIHGLLAFLIEPLGMEEATRRVVIHSPHAEVRAVYESFPTQFADLQQKNQTRVEVIRKFIAQTRQIDTENTVNYFNRQNRVKISLPLSALATAGALAFSWLRWESLSGDWRLLMLGIAAFFAICTVYDLVVWSTPNDTLCRTVLNKMATQETLLEQLRKLDEV
ncbi:MAG: hypothetical protein FWC16_14060 [Defluviitaleaceae bacterium]|nr:hypothetical protein [Defluviitaleaceae bacterium]MCL2276037.1 hypothetical protein [Defluviitaleaceae bacterium]